MGDENAMLHSMTAQLFFTTANNNNNNNGADASTTFPPATFRCRFAPSANGTKTGRHAQLKWADGVCSIEPRRVRVLESAESSSFRCANRRPPPSSASASTGKARLPVGGVYAAMAASKRAPSSTTPSSTASAYSQRLRATSTVTAPTALHSAFVWVLRRYFRPLAASRAGRLWDALSCDPDAPATSGLGVPRARLAAHATMADDIRRRRQREADELEQQPVGGGGGAESRTAAIIDDDLRAASVAAAAADDGDGDDPRQWHCGGVDGDGVLHISMRGGGGFFVEVDVGDGPLDLCWFWIFTERAPALRALLPDAPPDLAAAAAASPSCSNRAAAAATLTGSSSAAPTRRGGTTLHGHLVAMDDGGGGGGGGVGGGRGGAAVGDVAAVSVPAAASFVRATPRQLHAFASTPSPAAVTPFAPLEGRSVANLVGHSCGLTTPAEVTASRVACATSTTSSLAGTIAVGVGAMDAPAPPAPPPAAAARPLPPRRMQSTALDVLSRHAARTSGGGGGADADAPRMT